MEGFFNWAEKTIGLAHDLLGCGPKRHAPGRLQRPALSIKERGASSPHGNLLASRAPVVFAYNGGIGDHLCNLPALRALAFVFPNRLALVCGRGDRELYYSDLSLRKVHEIDFQLTNVGWTFNAKALAHTVGRCDLLISINPWHTGSMSELLARFPDVESVGFFPDFRHHLACDYAGHAIDMAFAVPAYLGNALKLSDFSQPPAISGIAVTRAREFKRRHVSSRRTLFVHTDTRPEKSWPRERFEHVLDTFLREFPEFVALVVDLRGEWVRSGRFRDRLIAVNLPLDSSFALLRESDLFLGIDSCHLHAADLFRVPGVGLFGPTTSRRWGFKFSHHRYVQGRGRMDTIIIDDVCEALCGLARGRAQRGANSLRAIV